MSLKKIDYNNPLPEYEGLTFFVDAFNERRRIQSVMPIFYEEQPLTWMLYRDDVSRYMKETPCAKVLDVGCGSGFWGLLVKKTFPQVDVVCLDKNPVAIERTRYNALLNKLDITLVEANYNRQLFDESTFDLIILTPPYHLYDPADGERIPLFARGGDYGLKEFYSQSKEAFSHLKENGMILFNQMSAGTDKPDYVSYYDSSFGIGKMEYTNILSPTTTTSFLNALYSTKQSQYLKEFAQKMPMLYYTSGIYIKSLNNFLHFDNTDEKKGILSKTCLNWQTRVELHREINKF